MNMRGRPKKAGGGNSLQRLMLLGIRCEDFEVMMVRVDTIPAFAGGFAQNIHGLQKINAPNCCGLADIQ